MESQLLALLLPPPLLLPIQTPTRLRLRVQRAVVVAVAAVGDGPVAEAAESPRRMQNEKRRA